MVALPFANYVKMNVFDGIFAALSYLRLSRPEQAKLLFLGLDNAGKSTLLLNLAHDQSSSVTPTVHPGSEELTIDNVVFATFDLGGPQQGGRLWEDHIHSATAVVFMVDAQDPGRFDEAAAKLHDLLAIEELKEVPFVVLGNKVDHPEVVPEAVLRERLRLWQVSDRPIELFMCSAAARMGHGRGLTWLARQV